jgi:hypothetical protein
MYIDSIRSKIFSYIDDVECELSYFLFKKENVFRISYITNLKLL